MKRNRMTWVIALLCSVIALASCLIVECAFSHDVEPKTTTPATTKASDPPITAKPIPEPTYSEEELEILALIIYQEAGADFCLDSTRQMVGEVFLNRVKSSRYPNTFYEVATQRSQYGHLYWTGIVWPERASLPQEQHAVKRAYDIAESLLSGSANLLLPSDAIYQAEFKQGSEVLANQDGLYFCK